MGHRNVAKTTGQMQKHFYSYNAEPTGSLQRVVEYSQTVKLWENIRTNDELTWKSALPKQGVFHHLLLMYMGCIYLPATLLSNGTFQTAARNSSQFHIVKFKF